MKIIDYLYLSTKIRVDVSGIDRDFRRSYFNAIRSHFKIEKHSVPDVLVIVRHSHEFSINVDQTAISVELFVPSTKSSFDMVYCNMLLSSYLAFQLDSLIESRPLLMLHGNTHYISDNKTGIVIISDGKTRGKTVLSMGLNEVGIKFLSDEYSLIDTEALTIYSPGCNFVTLRTDYLCYPRKKALNSDLLLQGSYISSCNGLNFFRFKNRTTLRCKFLKTKRILIFVLTEDKEGNMGYKNTDLPSIIYSQFFHHLYKYGFNTINKLQESYLKSHILKFTEFAEGYALNGEDDFGKRSNVDYIKRVAYE